MITCIVVIVKYNTLTSFPEDNNYVQHIVEIKSIKMENSLHDPNAKFHTGN